MATPKRTFVDTVEALRYGSLADELTDKLRELTLKCDDTKRAGSLTLTIKLKPGKGGQMEIVDDFKVVMPKEEKGTTLMFATPEGNLTRDDPRQLQIEGLRAVGTEPAGELRRAS